MATISVTLLDQTKVINYPDALENQFLPLAAEAYGYQTNVQNPAYNPTLPVGPDNSPIIANPEDALTFVMNRVTTELVGRVKNLLQQKQREAAEAQIRAAIDAQIGTIVVE